MSARESWKRRERVAKACWREPSIPNSRFPSIGRGRSRKMLCQVVLLAATCYGLAALVAAGQTGTANTWPQEGPVQHRTQELNRTKRHQEDQEAPLPAGLDEPVALQLVDEQQERAPLQRGKRTLYACEERQLQIECQLGESIQLIRANYGRFSIQICNEHGQLDWKVNCMSPQSFQIISNSCQAKQSCQLLASNSIFGDACPGTQKYLEVHYQCVPASQMQPSALNRTGQSMHHPASTALRANKPNVIQQQHENSSQQPMPSTTSERAPLAGGNPAPPKPPALPHWVPEGTLFRDQPPVARNSTKPHCPELVWRQIRWPASEAGMLVQMPCPAHAHSAEPYAASLVCLAGGVWAPRVQAARCQSLWLRNLTQRLEAGDSPLSIVAELVQRTQPPVAPFPAAQPALSLGFWAPQLQPQLQQASASLFGDDLAQLARVVHRLVDETGLVLSRISDDKQRLAFGREMVQALVELNNNLLHEHHLDAWQDLAAGERQRVLGQLVQDLEAASVQLAGVLSATSADPAPTTTTTGTTIGQESFVKVTDDVYVTIKSFALEPDQAGNINRSFEASFPSESSLLGTRWMNNEQSFTMHLQASGGPSASGFQAQAASPGEAGAQVVDVKYSPPATPSAAEADAQQAAMAGSATQSSSPSSGVQVLKIVFLMIRKLDGQMDLQQHPASGGSAATEAANNQRMVVNSNLVSMSIVADPRFKYPSVKVDLTAPIELVFKHNDAKASNEPWSTNMVRQRVANSKARCIYWDNIVSDWQSDGCKLVATNKTHSTCACNHLTSFALLSEWEEPSQLLAFNGSMSPTVVWPGSAQPGGWLSETSSGQNHQPATQHQHPSGIGGASLEQQAKVQLDSVENELILPNKLLYLAKLLDGHLFDQQPQQQLLVDNGSGNLRLIIYLSCLISAALFTLHLAAAAYNRAQARRLLGAIPANPPPPLLVSNGGVGSAAQLHPMLAGGSLNHRSATGQQQSSSTNNSEHTSPTYGSSSIDYSAALSASRAKQLAANPSGGGHFYDQLFAPSHYQCLQKLAKQRLSVPIHLVVQLLALELLLVLLVESQNYLQRMQSRRGLAAFRGYAGPVPEDPVLEPIGLVTWVLVLTLYYLVASVFTWLASQLLELNLDCFREARSAKSRNQLRPSNSTNSSVASDKSAQYGLTTATATSNSTAFASSLNPAGSGLYATSNRQLNANQLYLVETGQASCYGQTAAGQYNASLEHQQAFQSSTSPSSSLSSSAGGDQHLGGPLDPAHLHNQAHSGQQVANASRQLIGTTGNSRQRIASARRASLFERLIGTGCSASQMNNYHQGHRKPLNRLLVHLTPVLLAGLIGWLSAGKSQSMNALTFTGSLSSQLACWPLLVDCSSSGLSVLLYYLPALCFALAGLALFSLCRNRTGGSQHYGPSQRGGQPHKANFMMDPAATKPIGSSVVGNPYGSAGYQQQLAGGQVAAALNKQTDLDSPNGLDGAANWRPPVAFESKSRKRARFLCTIILALLALHSICWISFFAHIHLALNARDYSNKHLIVAFAASNLLFASLIVGSQRRLLRRAAKLAGLGRLLASCCCCCCSCFRRSPDRPTGAGALRGSAGRAWFYRQQVGARHQHQQAPMSGKPSKGANPLKVSPSSQSLFLISEAAQQHQQHHQPAQQRQLANYHYGPTYSSGSSQAAQHLYQQLANNNSGAAHIYDSASTLNEQQQQRLDMMQMMQQQQQPNNQYNSYTLNRPPVSAAGHHHQQLLLQRGQPPMAATLKPMNGQPQQNGLFRHSPAEIQEHRQQEAGQLLTLDPQAALKLQWSGEAEGPLVAFGGCSSQSTVGSQPAASSIPTFGPNQTARSASQQPLPEELRHHQQHLTEHQLFSAGLLNQRHHLHHQSRPASPSNQHISEHQRRQLCNQQGQQQQHCTNQSNNYTDALRAAMIQQQNELAATANEHHFRRANTNSKQQHQQRHMSAAMMVAAAGEERRQVNNPSGGAQCNQQLDLQANIYDVANYALNQ